MNGSGKQRRDGSGCRKRLGRRGAAANPLVIPFRCRSERGMWPTSHLLPRPSLPTQHSVADETLLTGQVTQADTMNSHSHVYVYRSQTYKYTQTQTTRYKPILAYITVLKQYTSRKKNNQTICLHDQKLQGSFKKQSSSNFLYSKPESGTDDALPRLQN